MLTPSEPVACDRGPDGRNGPGEAPDSQRTTAGHSAPPVPIPGIEDLWALTRGDERIGVALLDGPVDQAHPSLRGARLQQREGLVPSRPDGGPASRHGIHVASLVLGRPDGLAPDCRGVLI